MVAFERPQRAMRSLIRAPCAFSPQLCFLRPKRVIRWQAISSGGISGAGSFFGQFGGICRYGVSYRDLEEMLEERGVAVDHTTIYRWVQAYAPEIERRLRWHYRLRSFSRSWRVDETCIKVKGKWAYLCRAVDSRGNTVDFHLSQTRSASAAKRFPGKALRGCKERRKPCVINTDKHPCFESSPDSAFSGGFRRSCSGFSTSRPQAGAMRACRGSPAAVT